MSGAEVDLRARIAAVMARCAGNEATAGNGAEPLRNYVLIDELRDALGGGTDRDRRDLSGAFFNNVSWDDLTTGEWTHDPRELCDFLAGLALAAPALAADPDG